MRLHQFERSLEINTRQRFWHWKITHARTIYKLKQKYITIEPLYRSLSLQEKLNLKKIDLKAQADVNQAILEEQQQFETAVIELFKKTVSYELEYTSDLDRYTTNCNKTRKSSYYTKMRNRV